jgi:hypothetical protein
MIDEVPLDSEVFCDDFVNFIIYRFNLFWCNGRGSTYFFHLIFLYKLQGFQAQEKSKKKQLRDIF